MLALALCQTLPSQAAEATIAVASNFTAAIKALAPLFEKETGHTVKPAFGATGQFYSQIRNGAPFTLLLSADDETPALLERSGFGIAGTRFTYATGRLVLWSKTPDLIKDGTELLRAGTFARIAIANPKLAPYGAAAVEVMDALGLRDKLANKIVEAGNVTQAYQFVATGNASIGFVALSQVADAQTRISEGSGWIVPASLHAPIRQDAILLGPGKDNPAALAFLAFLQTPKAKALIRSHGYERD